MHTNMFLRGLALIFVVVFAVLTAEESKAGEEEGFLKSAQIIFQTASDLDGEQRLDALMRVRSILDQITEDYPASDVAVRILLQEDIEGIDVAALNREIAEAAALRNVERDDQNTDLATEPDMSGSDPSQANYNSPGPLERTICLPVQRDTKPIDLSRDLDERGIVSSAELFLKFLEDSGKSLELKAGRFLIRRAASVTDIAEAMTGDGRSTCGTDVVMRITSMGQRIEIRELNAASGRFEVRAAFDPSSELHPAYIAARDADSTKFRIELIAGTTSRQVLEGLKTADFLTGEPAGLPPEGSLAPGVYEVSPGLKLGTLIDSMRSRQAERLEQAWRGRDAGVPLSTPQDALILASIVELETGIPEERGQIASVFLNRLRQNMKLQSDPTVLYGIDRGLALGRGLRQGDLRTETPWNTYIVEGLPATPIANPSLASIEAVLSPEITDYLFFVSNGSGGHAFAATLEGHTSNVRRSREVELKTQTEAADLPRSEANLEPVELSRSERLEVQRRLSLIGYDTRGVDGIFGPGTRAAIEAWQAGLGLRTTGELTALQLAELRNQTEDKYRSWRAAGGSDAASVTTTNQPKRIEVGDTYYQVRNGVRYRCKRLSLGSWCTRATN